jgi:O-antigen/teichoic acid export membrane protein
MMKRIQQLARSFQRKKIAKNAAILLLSEILMRGLSIFYIAALARYIGTRGIGQISTATALTGMLVLVIAPGLNTLLVRDVAADHDKVGAYVLHSLFIKFLLSVPFFLLVLLVSFWAGYPAETLPIIYIYMVINILQSAQSTFTAAFQAFERMEYEALSGILMTLVNVTFSLLSIYFGLPLLVIVLCSLAAYLCQTTFMGLVLWFRLVRPKLVLNLELAKKLLMDSLPFGVLLILFAVKSQSGALILSLYRSQADVGVYSAANAMIGLLLYVPIAISTAIFPAFSRLASRSAQDLKHFYQLNFKLLLLIGFPLGLGTMLVGEKIMLLIYGDDFAESVTVLRILAIYLLTLVGYSNGPLLKTIGKQNFLVWTEILAVAGNVLLSIWFVQSWGPAGVAWAFVAMGLFTFIAHSLACHFWLHIGLPWDVTLKAAVSTIVMGFAVYFSMQAGLPWLIATILVAPAVYLLCILFFQLAPRSELSFLASAELHNPDKLQLEKKAVT